MCRIALSFAFVLVGCARPGPRPVISKPLGESTAPGPSAQLITPPDAAIVSGRMLSPHAIGHGGGTAPLPEEPPPPPPDAQPGVFSPPPPPPPP